MPCAVCYLIPSRPSAAAVGKGRARGGGASSPNPTSNPHAKPTPRYEHRVEGPEGLVFYRHAGSGAVSWEDPYESTLAAAAEAAGLAGAAAEAPPVVLEDSWTKCATEPDAAGDRKVHCIRAVAIEPLQ